MEICCECWLVQPFHQPKLVNTHSRVKFEEKSHYMDLVNSNVNERIAPCYVVCGLSYLNPDGSCLQLAVYADGSRANCPFCINIRAALEAEHKKRGGKPVGDVLF